MIAGSSRADDDALGRRCGNPFCIGFGDSTVVLNSSLSVSSDGNPFPLPSLGRRDSVEPLFLSERVVARPSSNRASSIWRRDIWPLRSSRRVFQSGTEVQRVLRASIIEYTAMVDVVSVDDVQPRIRRESWRRSTSERRRERTRPKESKKSSKYSKNRQGMVQRHHVGGQEIEIRQSCA